MLKCERNTSASGSIGSKKKMVEAEQEKEQEKLVLPSVSRLKMLLILHLLPLHFMDSKYPVDVFKTF